MNDLLLHEQLHQLGARRIHWRYDDPSGLAEAPVRVAGMPVRSRGETRRVRRHLDPKAA